MRPEIKNFRHNSVNFKFSNGNSIDAIFGCGTYSDNYDIDDFDARAWETFMSSSTVESMFNCGDKLAKRITKKIWGTTIKSN